MPILAVLWMCRLQGSVFFLPRFARSSVGFSHVPSRIRANILQKFPRKGYHFEELSPEQPS